VKEEENKNSDKQLNELSSKLDELVKRLAVLEKIIAVSPEYSAIANLIDIFTMGVRLYDEPIKVLNRLLSVRKYVEKPEVAGDEISRLTIQALAFRGPLNISQITREIKGTRGRASRKIVRERISKLVEEGIVIKEKGEGVRYRYRLVE
jgi:DNA-binding HxlR family transcriptional regulator